MVSRCPRRRVGPRFDSLFDLNLCVHRLMYITLGWILIGTGLLIPLTFTQVYAPRDKWDW